MAKREEVIDTIFTEKLLWKTNYVCITSRELFRQLLKPISIGDWGVCVCVCVSYHVTVLRSLHSPLMSQNKLARRTVTQLGKRKLGSRSLFHFYAIYSEKYTVSRQSRGKVAQDWVKVAFWGMFLGERLAWIGLRKCGVIMQIKQIWFYSYGEKKPRRLKKLLWSRAEITSDM